MPRKAVSDETRCIADNRRGQRCNGEARPGMDVCEVHDPDRPRGSWCPPPDERRCTATATGGYSRPERKGERCERWATPGTTVCTHHGSKAPQVAKRAAQRRAEERARTMASTYGLPVEITPEKAILDEVCRTAGHVQWLEEQVHGLTQGELAWGITRVKEGGDDYGTTEEAVPHALLKLYQQERAHLVKVCAEAIRCGIEERRIQLAQSQGHLVADAIRKILDDLRLTPEQQARIAEIVPLRLRELTAASN